MVVRPRPLDEAKAVPSVRVERRRIRRGPPSPGLGDLVRVFGGAAKDPLGGSFAGFGSIGRESGAIVVSFMGLVVRRI